jgi:hypothetical protein
MVKEPSGATLFLFSAEYWKDLKVRRLSIAFIHQRGLNARP